MTTTEQTPSPLAHLLRAAINAHSGTSFSPEKRGEQLIKEYEAVLQSDLDEISAADDETKANYKTRFIKHLNAWLSAKSRIVSTMIAGGSNFPVRRMEKYNRWEDSAYSSFSEFREKATKGILKQIEANKPQEQKQSETWARIERNLLSTISTIIDIDEGRNTYSSRPLFVSNLTGFIKRMAQNGQTDHVRKAIDLINKLNTTVKKPIVTANNSIFSLVEVAEAKQEKQEELKNMENKEFSFNGGVVILNYEIDRLQIKHDTKPQPEIIQLLKKNAFKWSPSQGVWQRQLTRNAAYASNLITGLKLG